MTTARPLTELVTESIAAHRTAAEVARRRELDAHSLYGHLLGISLSPDFTAAQQEEAREAKPLLMAAIKGYQAAQQQAAQRRSFSESWLAGLPSAEPVIIRAEGNEPAWIDSGHAGPLRRIAFRCQTCGKYALPAENGQLQPHWLKLVGRDKKKLDQHRCLDTAFYSTTDTATTEYLARTATARPA